jgi:beta-phosphoglucomutase-like phosphatase (HAD superfamily)
LPNTVDIYSANITAGRSDPDPETILKFAAHLRIDPVDCLVVEFDQFTNVKY